MVTGLDVAKRAQIPKYEGWGYIYGTAGILWTKEKQEEMQRSRMNDPNYAYSIKYGLRWIGHYVTDCSGLVVWVCKYFGISVPHGSNSIWKASLSEKGTIASRDVMLEGMLVFKVRGTDYHHVGIYIGSGQVVEAQGTKTGVTISSISSWDCWGKLRNVEYKTSDVKPLGKGKAIVDVPNDGTLNVRKSPSEKAEKTAKIREGTEIEVLAVSGDWAKIRYYSEGYVMSKFLKEV